MKNTLRLQRLARISGLTITLSLFLFLILDVGVSAQPEDGFKGLAILILSHLLWPGIALGMTLMTWKNNRLGAWLFSLAGAGYIAMAWGRFPYSVYVLIAGPFFLTSLFHGLSLRAMIAKRA